MRRYLRACLMASATELPTRPIILAPRKTRANELFASLRKWGKVVSNRAQ